LLHVDIALRPRSRHDQSLDTRFCGSRPLPGNEVVPDAEDQWTNAVAIRARPAAVWPWILQMGFRVSWAFVLLRVFHPVHFAMQRNQMLTLKRRVEATGPDRGPGGVGRLGTAAVWISAVCCLPYLVFKLLWTFGIPMGIADRSVLDDSGWVAGNAFMAVIQLAAFGLVLALTRPWARKWPAWLLLFPAWLGTGLLFQVVLGAMLTGLFSPPSQDSGMDTGEYEPWVFVVVYGGFAGQGLALAIAFACHVRARWGRLLGARTGEVLARRTARVRSWPENHLAEIAQAVALMAVVTAVVFCSWAAGGSFGVSGTEPDVPWGMQASRAAGAVIAAVGLLGLAGRWGQQTRFWLPAALTWLGSGALAGFDGFVVTFNQLFVMFGADASEAGWSLIDTVVLIKVAIGVLAAAVGALAVTAATKDHGQLAGADRTLLQAAAGDEPTA
jgi:hypothetical protein